MQSKWSRRGVSTPPWFAKVYVSSQQLAELERPPFNFRDLKVKGGVRYSTAPGKSCEGFYGGKGGATSYAPNFFFPRRRGPSSALCCSPLASSAGLASRSLVLPPSPPRPSLVSHARYCQRARCALGHVSCLSPVSLCACCSPLRQCFFAVASP